MKIVSRDDFAHFLEGLLSIENYDSNAFIKVLDEFNVDFSRLGRICYNNVAMEATDCEFYDLVPNILSTLFKEYLEKLKPDDRNWYRFVHTCQIEAFEEYIGEVEYKYVFRIFAPDHKPFLVKDKFADIETYLKESEIKKDVF
jgi:hypothetical protein